MSQDGSIELRQIMAILRRWLWLILVCMLVSAGAAFYIEALLPPVYEATATLMVKPAYDTLATQYNALIASERLALTYSQMVRGRKVLEPAIAASGALITPEELDKALEVEPVENTQLILLTVRHSSPATAMALANSVARGFAAHVSELQGSRMDADLADRQRKTESLAADRREIQSKLEAARADSVRNQVELARMQSLLTQLVQLSATAGDGTEKTTIANRLVQQLAPQPTLQLSELSGDEGTLAVNELATMGTLIEQVRTEIDELASMGSATSSNMAELELLLADYSDELRMRQRELEQFQQLAAEGADTIAITDPAREPQQPIRHRAIYVILAAMVGALIAFGVALLHESLDDTLRTTDEVRDAIALKGLGAIGRLPKEARSKAGGKGPADRYAEAYRMVGIRVRRAVSGESIRTVLVTSSEAAEGKSTTVANLAVALAQTGLNVIAVDADFRHPRLHHLFGMEPGRGLSDSLRDGRVDAYLQATPFEGVRLLTCGSAASGMGEELLSSRLPEVFRVLSERTDIVLVDSAPVLDVADASILAPQLDGVVLVLRAGRTRRQAAREAVESLQQVGGNLIGFVLNEVTADSTGYYRRYEGYAIESSAAEAGAAWAGTGSTSGQVATAPETR